MTAVVSLGSHSNIMYEPKYEVTVSLKIFIPFKSTKFSSTANKNNMALMAFMRAVK